MIEEGLNLRNDLLVPTITSAQAKQMPKDNPPVPTIWRCSSASSAAVALDRSLKAGGTVGDVVNRDIIQNILRS